MADPPSPPHAHDDRTNPHLAIRASEVWFGRFELRQVLGRGGMGVVWSAWDRRLEEWVALKFLPEILRWDAAALAALRQETQRARRLSHPNIVRVYDLHECEDGIALAMELIEGETLTDWRMRQPGGIVEPADIEPWLPGLCSALDYAHQEAGIVHRDIKPANLLLTRERQIRITDFSIASLIPGTMARISTVTHGGTLVYMSPQQLWGEPAGPADDIYSLGVTLYELLCGQPPFIHGDISRQIETRMPTLPNKLRGQLDPPCEPLPAKWESLLLSCLAKHPKDRPQTAGEIVKRLTAGSSAARKKGRKTRAIWVTAGIAGTAAVLAWFEFREPTTGAQSSPDIASLADDQTAGAPVYVFGAMANGILAHHPFDGSSRDFSSGGHDAAGQNVSYVPDRFGNPGNALRMQGTSTLGMTLGDIPGSAEAVTIAAWFLFAGSSDRIWSLKAQNDQLAGLELERRGRQLVLRATYADTQMDTEIAATSPTGPSAWHQVTVVVAGREASLYLDGIPAGSARLPAAPIRNGRSYDFMLGKSTTASDSQLDVVVDDLRIWHRALSGESVASLAAEDHRPFRRMVFSDLIRWPWEADTGYAITAATYAHDDDWLSGVRNEFGSAAALADWDDIKQVAGPWPALWAELLPLTANGARVLRGGRQFFAENRAYQVERFYSAMPGHYLAHSFVGTQDLVLGSWKGRAPIMARVPLQDRYHTVTWPAVATEPQDGITREADGSWRQRTGNNAAERPVTRRVWLIDLPGSFLSTQGFALQLGQARAALRRTEGQGWELHYQSAPDARAHRTLVNPAGKPKLWAVVQSEGRIYQTLLESTGDRAVCAELVVVGPAPDLSRNGPWALRADPAPRADISASAGVDQIRFITQYAGAP